MKKLTLLFLITIVFSCKSKGQDKEKTKNYPVTKTEAQWKAELSDMEYYVLREAGTERVFSSPLNDEHREGTFLCAACNTPLFKSENKFDSGTGWPSFTQPIQTNAVKYEKDSSFGMIRVEIMCNTCDAHLGHVFPDGPEPSGLRYCVNSESLILNKEG